MFFLAFICLFVSKTMQKVTGGFGFALSRFLSADPNPPRKESFKTFLDPGVDPDRHQYLVPGPSPTYPENFHQSLPVTFCIILLTSKQTNIARGK